MKKIVSLIFVLAITAAFWGLAGCGDGSHMQRALWSGSASDAQMNQSGAASLKCVDVTNYRSIDASQLGSVAEDETTETAAAETSESESEGDGIQGGEAVSGTQGNSGNPFLRPHLVISSIISATADAAEEEDVVEEQEAEDDAADVEQEAAEEQDIEALNKEIRTCIKAVIKSMRTCGPSCRKYWGSATWLLTRERLVKKPSASQVQIVRFQSCNQIREAGCLLVD